MGYRGAEAEYAVSALGVRVDTDPLAELVREALGVLARRPAPGLDEHRLEILKELDQKQALTA